MPPMIYTLYGFAIFFFVFWCGKWIIHILAISYGKYRLHKKVNNLPRETPLPFVSILKPLMGVDPNLAINLETFFTMNYPNYELLFCIEDKCDDAIEIVQKLREKYPKIESYLFLGGSNVGVNPKINNMYQGYQASKYELIMISDSGIKMKDDTLLDMVQTMTDKVGLVHQLPFTCDRDGFAATFEKIFFGTIQSRIYLCADLLGINCHTGMSCLMRKSIINDIGGLSKFGCYLAEDFFIAKSLKNHGWKMRISSQPAWQNSGLCDINNFQARLCRWTKLRVAMMPTTILLEPLSECLIVGAFASWSVALLFNWDSLGFYLIHILMWFLSDWILLTIVQNGTLSFNKFEYIVGWTFRELSGPYLFLNALWNPAIRWRERLYKLQWGGVAYELDKINDNDNNKININCNNENSCNNNDYVINIIDNNNSSSSGSSNNNNCNNSSSSASSCNNNNNNNNSISCNTNNTNTNQHYNALLTSNLSTSLSIIQTPTQLPQLPTITTTLASSIIPIQQQQHHNHQQQQQQQQQQSTTLQIKCGQQNLTTHNIKSITENQSMITFTNNKNKS